MATFRNRNGKWQARIQRQGQVPVSKSFSTRQEAERWARQVEAQIDQGRLISTNQDERTTLKVEAQTDEGRFVSLRLDECLF